MQLQNRLLLTLLALLSVVASIIACGAASTSVAESPTAPATIQLQFPTLTSPTESSGLSTRAPPTASNRTATKPAVTKHSVTATPPAQVNGFQTIAYSSLPPEAMHTLALIASVGPFPYRQDGQIFQNREGILPKKAQGYYHEYTVVTPGSDDRGARRIITGGKGELYYTDDHYSSFRMILK